jgi:mannose-6-phosphate isomerase-like protein (cupin superfamily)
MLAAVEDSDVPLLLLDEDHHVFMAQIPADVIVILGGVGIVDRKGEISAAESGTAIAEGFGHQQQLRETGCWLLVAETWVVGRVS